MTREDINDIINAICPNDEDYEKPCISPKYLRQELEQLALDQEQWNGEPTTKNDLGVDCISRADAIRVASGYCHLSNVAKELAKLPSVTPIRPKGHWIYDYTSADGHKTYHCSECACYLKPKHSEPLNTFKWCSLCGADMREVEE